jgi:uncharacterized protein
MQWHNEPPVWNTLGNVITVRSAAKTDFWRITHDGGIRDNGHFYYQPMTGDFIAEVKLTGDYSGLYDQAGLMARVDEANWLKCGVEYVEGVQYMSAVVTRDYSDWSIVPLMPPPAVIWLRLVRHGVTAEVHYSLDGEKYTTLRQAYFTIRETVNVGLMCASPMGEGFTATFDGLDIRAS